jgi:hypothetical protein
VDKDSNGQDEKLSTTLPGTVQKIIPSISPKEPDKAEIAIEGADDLYREIRIDNVLKAKNGANVELKKGAEVDVTIEADAKDTNKIKD